MSAFASVDPAIAHARVDAALGGIEWAALEDELNRHGAAVVESLLDEAQCHALAALYATEALFRSKVVMDRHGFGRGEYQYFAYPLPVLVERLRTSIYPHLAGIADRWNEALGLPARYPPSHADYLRECHAANQARPTPLLLRYGSGDYNCLHQDLYGERVFPLQVALLLSRPGQDFTGGEFVLTEQRPRMQSRAEVVPLRQGDAVIFAVHHRPVRGSKGTYRVNLRHGVSRLRSGQRHTLGIIFHDAA
ncbi:MAG TPA: 2OG-Fe(II) oxygenase [Dokdonella sp.]